VSQKVIQNRWVWRMRR